MTNKMRKLVLPFFTILSSIVCISCSSTKRSTSIDAFNVLYHVPIVNPDNSVTNYDNSYDVFYQGDLRMYKVVYSVLANQSGQMVEAGRKFRYFVFHKDSAYARIFEPDADKFFDNQRARIDSMLQYNTFENPKLDTFATVKPDTSYVDSIGSLVKIFKKSPLSPNEPDRYIHMFYYSNKMPVLKEIFSRRMGNQPNMKLYRVRILAKGGYYAEAKMTIPDLEYFYLMKPITIENPTLVKEYFDKYAKRI
jgi:hypothetical protein